MALAALSLLGILLIIHADFRSIRLTALVALTLPFALIGGVVGAILGGGVLSLGSLVGFVTVLGIAARNGIMLVSHYRHLELEEGEPFGLDLVIRGSEERLAPILMTALATGLALVPLASAGNKPGHEIEHPMAIVILGGLVTSTVLNLFLMPALYLAFGKAGSRAEDEEAEAADAAADRLGGNGDWAAPGRPAPTGPCPSTPIRTRDRDGGVARPVVMCPAALVSIVGSLSWTHPASLQCLMTRPRRTCGSPRCLEAGHGAEPSPTATCSSASWPCRWTSSPATT